MSVGFGVNIGAAPQGIVDGVDYEQTGLARKVEADTINFALNSGSIVLMSNLGFSATGEAFNLSMEDVAAATAIALDADKLVFVTETPGVLDDAGQVVGEVSEALAQQLLAAGSLTPETAFYLRHALRACEGGVARAHLIPFNLDGSMLLELFQHDGVGTMVVEETLEALREATADDVGGLVALIRPLEEDGTLVRRDRARIEREVGNFTVIEHDGVIFGCAATSSRAIGITSIGNGKRPRVSTCLEASTMHTKRSKAPATIFSRVSAPPPPLIIRRPGSISSAPST